MLFGKRLRGESKIGNKACFFDSAHGFPLGFSHEQTICVFHIVETNKVQPAMHEIECELTRKEFIPSHGFHFGSLYRNANFTGKTFGRFSRKGDDVSGSGICQEIRMDGSQFRIAKESYGQLSRKPMIRAGRVKVIKKDYKRLVRKIESLKPIVCFKPNRVVRHSSHSPRNFSSHSAYLYLHPSFLAFRPRDTRYGNEAY